MHKIYRIPSVFHKDNVVSCGLSFLKCITIAKKLQKQKILICEDDITFHDKSKELWVKCQQELPNDWDILLEESVILKIKTLKVKNINI